jgi:hypothetical protein
MIFNLREKMSILDGGANIYVVTFLSKSFWFGK